MNWEDECYLLSKKKFRENGSIINVFTSKKGKVTGIVYGGTSRKIRNYLQISNKLFVVNNLKNENKIGYFKTELIKAITPIYFSDKKRTSALVSICALLNILLPEAQPHKEIFKTFEKFIEKLNLDNWIILYIFFEINLIRELGYDANLSSFDNVVSNDDEIRKIKVDGYHYEVPIYLIKGQIPLNLNLYLIKKSLIFTRSLLLNKFFIPNNLILPKSRIILENYFN